MATSLSLDVLIRYIAGDASPLECARVQQWLDVDPGRADIILALRRLGTRANDRTHVPSVDALWARVDRRNTEPRFLKPAVPRIPLPRAPMLWRTRSAVALATVAVLAAGIAGVRAVSNGVKRHASVTYATVAGQLTTVTLGDGSTVTLAPRTTLRVADDFGARDRAVELTGEAHFNVRTGQRLPFVVRTGGVTTRVLGTIFDVRRYAGDSSGEVVVYAGKVASGAGTGSMVVTAGMTGHFTDSAVTGVTAADSSVSTDWEHGRLIFRNAPASVILATLRQWYGYEFRLADPALATRCYSAVFLAGDTPEMLNIVSHMLSVSITREDSVLVLRPNQNIVTPAPAGPSRQHHLFHTPTKVGR